MVSLGAIVALEERQLSGEIRVLFHRDILQT